MATVTEIYDYMRVLFARAGIPYSPLLVNQLYLNQLVKWLIKLKNCQKVILFISCPIVRGRKGEYKKEILNYKKRGFTKIKVDGNI